MASKQLRDTNLLQFFSRKKKTTDIVHVPDDLNNFIRSHNVVIDRDKKKHLEAERSVRQPDVIRHIANKFYVKRAHT